MTKYAVLCAAFLSSFVGVVQADTARELARDMVDKAVRSADAETRSGCCKCSSCSTCSSCTTCCKKSESADSEATKCNCGKPKSVETDDQDAVRSCSKCGSCSKCCKCS